MKKQIIALAAVAAATVSANGQGMIVGWDFADVINLGQSTTYAAEKTAFNNSVSTSGSIYADGTFGSDNLGTDARFIAAGRQATGNQFLNGFDITTTNNIGASATGQQGFEVTNRSSAYQFTIGFTSAYDVTVEFDWANSAASGGAFGDFLNVSYSADGTTWTSYAPNSGSSFVAANSYAAFETSSGAWAASTDTPGTYGFVDGQSDATIDLSGIAVDEASAIQYVRFEVLSNSAATRVAFDNILVSGTAVVPEPSTFGAIFGVVALGFVAARRRK